jgi:hypothetical protein
VENPEKRNDTQKWQIQHQVFFYPRMAALQMFSPQDLQQFLVNYLDPCDYIGFEIPTPCKELQRVPALRILGLGKNRVT